MTTHFIDEAGLIALTQDLVRLETLSGEEGPAIQRTRQAFEALGFTQIHEDDLGNVTGTIRGDLPGPTLLFDAHVDTVGIAPGVPWTLRPLRRGDRLWAHDGPGHIGHEGGLGRGHLCGSGPGSVYLGRAGGDLRQCHGGGAGRGGPASRHGPRPPDFVVIGESTELNLAIGGRGRAEIHVEAVGQPAHSSSPHLGINAVELMMDAARAIATIPLGTDPMLGDALIALTDIHSEPYPANSVIASQCRVTYDRRLLAGESVESVLGPIQAAATAAQGAGAHHRGGGDRGVYDLYGCSLAHPQILPGLEA